MVMAKGCTPALAVLAVWQMESVQFYQNACLQGDGAMREATFLSKRTKPSFPSQTSPHLTCSDSYTLQLLTMGILPLASVQLLISSSFPLKMISLTCPCKRSNLMHVKKV